MADSEGFHDNGSVGAAVEYELERRMVYSGVGGTDTGHGAVRERPSPFSSGRNNAPRRASSSSAFSKSRSLLKFDD